jgi:transcriptional regulator with XRE-family HTH domain
MGEDYQKVGRIERGKRSLTLDYLLNVSKALEIPVSSFLESEEKHEKGLTQEDTVSLLNEIVVLIEEKYHQLPFPLTPKQKGQLIAKIYQSALQFPPSAQRLLVTCFFEGLLSIYSDS